MTTLSVPASILCTPPSFTDVSEWGRRNYEQFIESTNPDNIQNYGKGSNLQELSEFAANARNVIHIARLNVSNDSRTQDQWQLNRLSEIKERLSKAISLKRGYYDNHLFGIITKYVLMLFGKWNGGDTAAIVAAEDFLLMWDSRKPIIKISHPENPSYGKYSERLDFRTSNLDASRFYNYNPKRLIEMQNGEKTNYNLL